MYRANRACVDLSTNSYELYSQGILERSSKLPGEVEFPPVSTERPQSLPLFPRKSSTFPWFSRNFAGDAAFIVDWRGAREVRDDSGEQLLGVDDGFPTESPTSGSRLQELGYVPAQQMHKEVLPGESILCGWFAMHDNWRRRCPHDLLRESCSRHRQDMERHRSVSRWKI